MSSKRFPLVPVLVGAIMLELEVQKTKVVPTMSNHFLNWKHLVNNTIGNEMKNKNTAQMKNNKTNLC